MARDLDFALEILGVPIVRDADGLALSSRNAYLTAAERAAALALPHALRRAAEEIRAGSDVAQTLAHVEADILAAGFAQVDYFALADAVTLEELQHFDGRPARLLAAAEMGKTRLIDNLAI
jgi:pantoate--beta-alanine ligase